MAHRYSDNCVCGSCNAEFMEAILAVLVAKPKRKTQRQK